MSIRPKKIYTLPERTVQVLDSVDIVVVGGGYTGVCAAVAATRLGAKVAIIERDGMLGGQAAEIFTFGVEAYTDANYKHIIKGIPFEILQKTIAEGNADPVWDMVDYERMEKTEKIDAIQALGLTPGAHLFDAQVDPAAFRYVLQTLVNEEEITTFFECSICDVLQDGDRIKGIVAMHNYSPFAVEAKIIVDATPHAVVAALAGRKFPSTDIYLGTHPRIAGIDIHRFFKYVEANKDDVKIRFLDPHRIDAKILESLIEKNIPLHMNGFKKARQKAIADDPIYEETGRYDHRIVFYYDRNGYGGFWINTPKTSHGRLDNPLHLSKVIGDLRKSQYLTYKLFRKYVPGFENSVLMDIHPHIARAINISLEPRGFTEFDISKEHIETEASKYEDSIARVFGHPGFGQSDDGFQVPYRSLIPKGLQNLLITGKPVCSMMHIHATNAAVGQAAGVAAAIAVKDGVTLRELSVANVQKALKAMGAVV